MIIERIPDYELLKAHKAAKRVLIEKARLIMKKRTHRMHNSMSTDILTIGFARRFATYKRATLLLRDPDRLERIIRNPKPTCSVYFCR